MDTYDCLICDDCAIWCANGDSSGMDDSTVDRITDPKLRYFIVGDEFGFSWWRCDRCGSSDGGTRHEAFEG